MVAAAGLGLCCRRRRSASRLKCAKTSAENTGNTSQAGGNRLISAMHKPINQYCRLYRRHIHLRSPGLACSITASTRSIRVNAKDHQKMGSSTGKGGISQSGMVMSQPNENKITTQTAFQAP